MSLLAGVLVLTSACGTDNLARTRAIMVVEPDSIDFGGSPVLFEVTQILTIRNPGSSPLNISLIELEGDPVFSLGDTPEVVGQGDEVEIQVHFLPTAEEDFEALIVVEGSDPELPRLEIPVVGTGSTASAVKVEPEALDFGRVGENHSAVRVLRLESTGSAPLMLKSIGFSTETSAAYSIVGSSRTPLILNPGSSDSDTWVELMVSFAPVAGALETQGTLLLETSDPERQLLEIPLIAEVNRQPVAVPGDDLREVPGAEVSLDGSESYDPDGDEPLSYSWELVQSPAGSEAVLKNADSAASSFVLDQPGPYLVQLVVKDSAGLASKAELVTVTAISGEGLEVELVWDHHVADLDLHFSAPGVELYDADDCNRWECEPSFGFAGDPSHSGDILAGSGPESVTWLKPLDGSYLIRVRYESAMGDSNATALATVRIYLFGIVARELHHVFDTPGQVWEVGTLHWPSGEVRN